MTSLLGIAPTATEGMGVIPAVSAGGGSPVEPVLAAGGTVGRTGALGSPGAGALWKTLTTPMDAKTRDNMMQIARLIAQNKKDVPPMPPVPLPARGGGPIPGPTASQFMRRRGGIEALLQALGAG